MFDLSQELGIPLALGEIGMPASGLDQACDIAVSNPYWNPRPIEAAPLRQMLQRAWSGARPAM